MIVLVILPLPPLHWFGPPITHTVQPPDMFRIAATIAAGSMRTV